MQSTKPAKPYCEDVDKMKQTHIRLEYVLLETLEKQQSIVGAKYYLIYKNVYILFELFNCM